MTGRAAPVVVPVEVLPAQRWNFRRIATPKLDESDWEAILKLLQLLATFLGKRHATDFISVAMDPTVGFRLMRQHGEAYKHALEATCTPLLDDVTAGTAQVLANAARAAAFACAAYGAAMRQGHLNSVSTFLGGAVVHNMQQWTPAENTAAFVSLAGLQLQDLLLSSWTERTFEPAFCIAWAPDRRWLVLSIRGSVDWRSLLTDATAHAVPIAGGLTHEGMLRGARSVLERALSLIRTALLERPDFELVCAGHSLGAGTAALVALLLREGEGAEDGDPPALRRASAYGIGTPPLLSPELAERTAGFVVTLVRGMDFISRLSVFAVDRLLYELTQASAGKIFTDFFMKSIGGQDPYKKRFERTFGPDIAVAEVLLPPGRIVHIDTRSRLSLRPGLGPPEAFWGVGSFYHRYLLGSSMLRDHLPREYLTDICLIAAAASTSLPSAMAQVPCPAPAVIVGSPA